MYEYKAKIIKVSDGDTLVVDIDLGFRHTMGGVKLRLYGVNTPELVGKERAKALEAKKFVQTLLHPGDEVVIRTYKDKTEKYGRYLADVYIYESVDSDGKLQLDEISVNKKLINAGLADKYLL